MPSELTSKDQVKKLLPEAIEIRVVRSEDSAKLKLRTKKSLYTYKTTGEDADAILKGVKAPIVEV